MPVLHFDFVDVVVSERELVVTSGNWRGCRLEPRQSDLAWHCDLDDGTPTGENDPASYVRWVCPTLRLGPATAAPIVDVRRTGPQSDLGKVMKELGRLAARLGGRPTGVEVEGRFAYTDPAGILDAALRRRIESGPPAMHGDGVVQPVELTSIKVTREGLIVESASWWDSAPALDHQIGLAVDIARRVAAQQ